jgi:DNA-nicking Smr family endonuclease
MPRRPTITDEDCALFRAAAAGARPLRRKPRFVPDRPRPPPRARFTEADDQAVLEELARALPDGELETGDEQSWRIGGIQDSVMRKLRRGQYTIGRELDLHGYTAAEAKLAVVAFVERARADHITCVRIIHGKGHGSHQGRPVLKQLVGGWLRQLRSVAAYASARAADGGTGALVVLLRKP